MQSPWKIWMDTGGTFTDCISIDPQGKQRQLKVLSSGVLRVTVVVTNQKASMVFPFPIKSDFLTGFSIRWGQHVYQIKSFDTTTHAVVFNQTIRSSGTYQAEIYTGEEVPIFAARLLTETSLNTSLPPMELKLGSTRGTNALLEHKGARTALLLTKGFKDLLRIGTQQRADLFSLNIQKPKPLYHSVEVVSERIAADGTVLQPLQAEEINRVLQKLRKSKIQSVAVAFMNSYKNPNHETQIGLALQRAGFNFISLSHQLSAQIKILPRAETALVNAYLDPIIHHYLNTIQQVMASSTIHVMSSAGGLLQVNDFKPKDSLLSGPAGGVIGALSKARLSGVDQIITFDMGGTSTDVSCCHGRPTYQFDCTVGTQKIRSPSIAIETIAAGGGSICAYDGFRFTVGPHSAGASPGPACYGQGGPLTITDVNLLLGRIDTQTFAIPIDVQQAESALAGILQAVNKRATNKLTREEVLFAFIEIANEKMAEAIRKVSIQQGYDPTVYSLVSFGGAGGQHACAIAAMLGITKLVVPYEAGLLSAYGIGHAVEETVLEKSVLRPLVDVHPQLDRYFDALKLQVNKGVSKKKYTDSKVAFITRLVFLRLQGQESTLEIEWPKGADLQMLFKKQYKKVYGHWMTKRTIEVESIRLIVARQEKPVKPTTAKVKRYSPQPHRYAPVWVSGKWRNCPVFQWEQLAVGATIHTPALIVSKNSTLLLENGWTFFLDRNQNAQIRLLQTKRVQQTNSEAAKLELFTNRFTAIAQDMGARLQRSSFSVNVKERLDFSCALLDERGNLVVNAPHIPVHLGSMGVCVREVLKVIDMQPGDVIITNHPAYGGSHLPDVTLIMPVYFKKHRVGFVANRAHHAEIGGSKPGSMPADATCLEEEGVVISPTYLVKRGQPQWKKINDLFKHATYPSRALAENIADLQGALASLVQGEQALKLLCKKHTLPAVKKYMERLRIHAAELIKSKISKAKFGNLNSSEVLDDGAKLCVSVRKTKNRLVIDFSGSASVHPGNLNATPAIVNSVVLYVLRLWVNAPVPLNEGLLDPIKLVLPRGLLNPQFFSDNRKSPAVVGGNTEVSQRLTDTLLKAFSLAACSQGTMNNFLFGNETFGYYETICGGVGAGSGFDGADAVHQHMTNTRITDPEILEFRYPVRLIRFEIRSRSGGVGKWSGGNGVVRELYFLEKLAVNVLSQHCIIKPYGMQGGEPGKTGEQWVIRKNGKRQRLAGSDGTVVGSGDRLIIKTPGGGGWGKVDR